MLSHFHLLQNLEAGNDGNDAAQAMNPQTAN